MNYIELFVAEARKNGSKTAVVDCNGSRMTTYSELDRLSSKISGKIKALGCTEGDYVVIYMNNCVEYIAAYLGVLKAGCAAVPLAMIYPQNRVDYIVSDCNAKLVIRQDFFDDIEQYDEYCVSANDATPAYVVYTSGSTGNPKGICHTVHDIYACAVRLTEDLFKDCRGYRRAAFAQISFVASFFEIFVGLLIENSIYIIPEDTKRSPGQLVDFLNKNSIDVVFFPPSFLRLIDENSICLKRIDTAGEVLSRICFEKTPIYNLYGQSEMNAVTSFPVTQSYDFTPIGKPLKGLTAYVLDKDGMEVADGIKGELCIEGDFDVSYINDPEKTSKTFVKLENGNTLIHTGDTVYRNESGDIVYVSRMDWMVKVNGQRVETMEVEHKLNSIDGIEVSAVRAWIDSNGQNYIAGYYQKNGEITEDEIRQNLAKSLPEYMIPRFLICMDELPKNTNGKLDRISLPEPEACSYKEEYVAPTTELEKQLCDGFEAVLHCGRVGICDNFFALGGDSIKVLLVLNTLNIEKLTVDTILLGKTPKRIAELLKESEHRSVSVNHTTDLSNNFPLTEAQIGIYMECVNEPQSLKYNVSGGMKITKDYDEVRFVDAVKSVVNAHPAFFVKIDNVVGMPAMKVASQDIEIEKARADSIEEAKKRFIRPFDLANGPLFRFAIYQINGESIFLFDVHHIIFDGTSVSVFLSQVKAAYEGNKIAEEELTIFDIAKSEENLTESEEYNLAHEFFAQKFKEEPSFATLDPDCYGEEKRSTSSMVSVKNDVFFKSEDVIEYTKKHGITCSTLFMGAFAYVLAEFTGNLSCGFTTVNSGRHDIRLKDSVGMFVKTLPITTEFKAEEKIKDYLYRLQNDFYETILHDCIAFGELVSLYGVNNDMMFVYQSDMLNSAEMYDTGDAVNKIAAMVFKEETGFRLELRYMNSLYSEEIMNEFAECLMNVVSEMIRKEQLGEIEICSDKQLKKLDEFNPSKYPDGGSKTTFVSLFREAVCKYPDVTALVFKDKRFTYKQLDKITDILSIYIANVIEKKDKQPIVSILIPRNEYMAIIPLAAQKAGCAFQPLDPNYPPDRLNFMVKDAEASLVVADPSLQDILTDYAGKTLLTTEIDEIIENGKIDAMRDSVQLEQVHPEDAFIILYTSGSTGTPKGVVLEQRNLATYCLWYKEKFPLMTGDNVACYASFGFDVHMSEIYGGLASGYTCHIIPEEIRLDLIALNDYFEKNNIKMTILTTAIATQFVTNIENNSLKYLVTGGEKLISVDPPQNYLFVNGYGPTEATIFVTAKNVLEKEDNIPIGVPHNTVRCYVTDKYMHRLPIGAVGELLIAGPQVARVYLNRPDKTAEVFIEDPFNEEELDYFRRAYRSGDMVRYRANGDIEYVGRRDNQIKIHGYRIELQEIELVIREIDGIKNVTVQAFSDEHGEKHIAAYVVSDGEVDETALCEYVASKKPAYMVPEVVVQIEEIPLNVNQKVDKKKLPKPELNSTKKMEKAVTDIPFNVLEQRIVDIISNVISTKEIGITENLSYYGLNSILAIRLATLIYKEFNVQIKTSELLKSGTLQNIENVILSSFMAKDMSCEKEVIEETQEKNSDSRVLLSFEQKGIYAECQKTPDSTLYNIPFCVRFPKGVRTEELKEAVRTVIMAHPSFSLRFEANEKNEIVQYFDAEYEPKIGIKKMTSDELQQYSKEFVHTFSLTDEPLARFEIVESDFVYLLMDIHHLIADGSSADIFFQQVCACLEGNEPAKEDYTYLDHVQNEKVTDETEAFFKEQMANCGEITQLIPDVFEQGLDHTEGIVRVETNLKEVSEYAAKQGITPAGVYLAAEYIACARYVCEDSVAISTISGGRSDLRIHNTVGMFINTLPLVAKIDNEEETISFVKRVSKDFEATIEHEHYPFSLIAEKYDFHPAVSYTYQVGVINSNSVHGEAIELNELALGRAKLPVSVYITGNPENGGYIQVNYDEALFSKNMMLDFARSIENAVCGLMSQKTLSQISLTNEEQWKVLDSYNRPFDLNYDRNDTVVSLFRKQVAESPNKIAAVYKEKSYTFRELDELTDRLAEVLYEELVGITGLKNLAEQVVSIIISRSENAFILPLAVLKSGCAYEPLDPEYPADRLNFMVKDSGARLLLAERELADIVNEVDCKIMAVDELYARAEESRKKGVKVSALEIPAPKPENLLIMLYTSGTTGMPKGVQLVHGNLVAFTHGSKLDGLYTKESRTATYASFGFDVNMADTFCTMLNGGTIYLIPEEERMNLGALAEYFDKEEITDVLLTTQVGVQFINSYPKLKTLRMLTVGGEKLPAINTEALSYTVYNGYGPTENCAGVSIFPIRRWEPNIPIGRPVQTIHAFVLDKTGHRIPAGAAGEYCLSGPQVARGYLNRPEKTAEAFEKCPFNEFNMYHTGDIVRYRENGDVEFVGRKDGQVKIRGFRVELKEVETVILGYEGIKDVTVQAYDFENGGKYLAAFVVCDGVLDTKAIASYIRERKPAYMVPAVIMQIDAVPLTVNRKVDKKALPKPELQKAEFVAPVTEAEKAFCNIFGEILGIEKVGAEDDFFDLGGSSISAMKVVLAAGKAGYEIVYQNVFDFSTPRLLASYAGGDTSDSPKKLVGEVEKAYIGRDGYDYSKLNELLSKNTLEAFKSNKQHTVGDVFLIGPTGFLGIHVLHELLMNGTGKIWCFTRSKGNISGENRLKEYLKYYFNDSFEKFFEERICVIEGDALDKSSFERFNPKEKNITVINCAANVAHFAKGDIIARTNVGSVENLIDWCIKHEAFLIHVSTGSVVGASQNGIPSDAFKLDEHALFKGQFIENNQYVHSKFIAERTIYEAILQRGLRAKVMRVSNLAPRFDDGMVQINYETNNALCTLKAYKNLGLLSYDLMGTKTEYSPIDYVARALLTLAKTPEDCICFNLMNDYMPYMGDVIMRLSSKIRLVEPEELEEEVTKALNNPERADIMRPLLAYSSNKRDGDTHMFGFDAIDSTYTSQILCRLGFRWPVIDDKYIERFAKRLEEKKFF